MKNIKVVLKAALRVVVKVARKLDLGTKCKLLLNLLPALILMLLAYGCFKVKATAPGIAALVVAFCGTLRVIGLADLVQKIYKKICWTLFFAALAIGMLLTLVGLLLTGTLSADALVFLVIGLLPFLALVRWIGIPILAVSAVLMLLLPIVGGSTHEVIYYLLCTLAGVTGSLHYPQNLTDGIKGALEK